MPYFQSIFDAVTKRHMVGFIIVAVFSTATAIFLVNKAEDATREVDALNYTSIFRLRKVVTSNLNPQGVDVSDWKTFHSLKYGFEVLYPKSWSQTYPRPGFPTAEWIDLRSPDSEMQSVSIRVLTEEESLSANPERLNAAKWAETRYEPGTYKSYIINDVPAVKVNQWDAVLFHQDPFFEVYISDSSHIVEKNNFMPVDPKLFDNIISTFNFLR